MKNQQIDRSSKKQTMRTRQLWGLFALLIIIDRIGTIISLITVKYYGSARFSLPIRPISFTINMKQIINPVSSVLPFNSMIDEGFSLVPWYILLSLFVSYLVFMIGTRLRVILLFELLIGPEIWSSLNYWNNPFNSFENVRNLNGVF